MSKLATARRVLQVHGTTGLLLTLAGKLAFHPKIDRWVHHRLGRLVEGRGNVVTIDDCEFSVNSAVIPTDMKSLFLFDQYENPEREALKQFLNPELPVIEFGGSIGVVSCLTNKQLANPHHHVVVEANPDILPLLEENRNRNNCRFTILHRVIAYEGAAAIFHQDVNFLGSRANDLNPAFTKFIVNSISVPTIKLRDIVDTFDFERCTLICDIEGGEIDLVLHELDVLRESVRTLIIEVHEIFVGADSLNKMFGRLEEAGFRLVYRKSDTCVFENAVTGLS